MRIKLYRADVKGNKTCPDKFKTDGLLTKQLNGGNPELIWEQPLLKLISSHVNPNSEEEKTIYNTTSFLSFSENEDIVRYTYLTGLNNDVYNETDYNDANGFIFTIEIEKHNLEFIVEGVYQYNYYCNYEKFKDQVFFPLRNNIGCSFCKGNPSLHTLIIVDVVCYLENNGEVGKGVLGNAERDKEWLLLPVDLFVDSVGYHSRIPVANFLDVKYFKKHM